LGPSLFKEVVLRLTQVGAQQRDPISPSRKVKNGIASATIKDNNVIPRVDPLKIPCQQVYSTQPKRDNLQPRAPMDETVALQVRRVAEYFDEKLSMTRQQSCAPNLGMGDAHKFSSRVNP
jgi:hypothetical protein